LNFIIKNGYLKNPVRQDHLISQETLMTEATNTFELIQGPIQVICDKIPFSATKIQKVNAEEK
jgi:hypothetical protein